MNYQRFLIIVFINALFTQVYCKEQYYFTNKNSNGGLLSNEVNAVHQDRQGYMWFGTPEGLCKFDGLKYQYYRHNPADSNSISGNNITAIVEDNNDNLIVGTGNTGIFKLNLRTEKVTRFTLSDSLFAGCKNREVRTFFLDSQGNLWISTRQDIIFVKDINSLNGNSTNFCRYDILRDPIDHLANSQYCFAQDIDKKIVIGTRTGLLKVDIPQNIKSIKSNPIVEMASLPSGLFNVKINKDGLFALCKDGIYRYPLASTPELIPEKVSADVTTNLVLGKSNLYFSGGVVSMEAFSFDSIQNLLVKKTWGIVTGRNLPTIVVNAFYTDNLGDIWVGTKRDGVLHYSFQKSRIQMFKSSNNSNSLPGNSITSLFEDSKNNLWLGTMGTGLAVLEGRNKSDFDNGFIRLTSDKENLNKGVDVFSINECLIGNGASKIIASTSFFDGIVELKYDSAKRTVDYKKAIGLGCKINVVVPYEKGQIWAGSDGVGGLFLLEYNKKTDNWVVIKNFKYGIQVDSLVSNIIRSILVDKRGNVWVGTDRGISILTKEELAKKTPKFLRIENQNNDKNSLPYNYILPIIEAQDGIIWVGTKGGGMAKVLSMDSNGVQFQTYSVEHGMRSNSVYAIVEDESQNLWLSSNMGLAKFNPTTEKFLILIIKDGLQGLEYSELSILKRRSGEIIFGGISGLNAFLPSKFITVQTPTPVFFNSLTLQNRVVKVGEEIGGRVLLQNAMNHTKHIELDFSNRNFSIDFSGLNYASTYDNSYRYRMLGFDSTWIKTVGTDRTIRYADLPEGEYVLEVLGSNCDGVENKTSSKLEIIINPPYYRSLVAYILYLIIIVVLLWYFRQYTIISVTNKQKLVLADLEKKQQEELTQVKLTFFTNVSHEFRTPVNLIISPLERLMNANNNISPAVRDNLYRIMHKNARTLMRLINQLLDFKKIEQGKMGILVYRGDMVEAIKDAIASFSELAEMKKIEVTLNSYAPSVDLFFDPEKIERILYNLFSNAFKFTPKGGYLHIDIRPDMLNGKEAIAISFKNSGKGIPADQLPFLFDRYFQVAQPRDAKVVGTGIGLSFTKDIVLMHKGEISVQSVENQDTTFIIKFLTGRTHFADHEVSIDFI